MISGRVRGLFHFFYHIGSFSSEARRFLGSFPRVIHPRAATPRAECIEDARGFM